MPSRFTIHSDQQEKYTQKESRKWDGSESKSIQLSLFSIDNSLLKLLVLVRFSISSCTNFQFNLDFITRRFSFFFSFSIIIIIILLLKLFDFAILCVFWTYQSNLFRPFWVDCGGRARIFIEEIRST